PLSLSSCTPCAPPPATYTRALHDALPILVAGDTFYGIAYANDMSMSDLEALNPGIDINRLMVGDVLNVKELTPVLSVQTVEEVTDRKSTRLNSSHVSISYAVFCLKKKNRQ